MYLALLPGPGPAPPPPDRKPPWRNLTSRSPWPAGPVERQPPEQARDDQGVVDPALVDQVGDLRAGTARRQLLVLVELRAPRRAGRCGSRWWRSARSGARGSTRACRPGTGRIAGVAGLLEQLAGAGRARVLARVERGRRGSPGCRGPTRRGTGGPGGPAVGRERDRRARRRPGGSRKSRAPCPSVATGTAPDGGGRASSPRASGRASRRRPGPRTVRRHGFSVRHG